MYLFPTVKFESRMAVCKSFEVIFVVSDQFALLIISNAIFSSLIELGTLVTNP